MKGEPRRVIDAEVTADLVWALRVISGRAYTLEELRGARALWHWHARFEKEARRKQLAVELEALFEANDLAREFEALTSYDRMHASEKEAKAKALELAEASAEGIQAFVERALVFLGGAGEFHRVLHVAAHTGKLAAAHGEVQRFATRAIAGTDESPLVQFAAVIIATWMRSQRSGPRAADVPQTVAGLLDGCGSGLVEAHLFSRLYAGSPPPLGYNEIGEDEIEMLRARVPRLARLGYGPICLQALGWTLRHDWTGLKRLVAETMEAIRPDQRGASVHGLLDAAYWVVCRPEGAPTESPPDLATWLLDQFLRIGDLDLDGSLHWHVEEVLKVLGPVELSWLVRAVRSRLTDGHDGHLPAHNRLSSFVRALDSGVEPSDEERRAVAELVDLAASADFLGHALPQYIREVDPQGVVAPQAIREAIERAGADHDRLWRLSRIGGAYDEDSPSWRCIARAALAASAGASDADRRSIYFALSDRSPRGFSVRKGEIPEQFVTGVDVARRRLEAESDAAFRPLWEAHLRAAETELREWEDRALESGE